MTSILDALARTPISGAQATVLEALVVFLLVCALTARELVRANEPHSDMLAVFDGLTLPLLAGSALVVGLRLSDMIAN